MAHRHISTCLIIALFITLPLSLQGRAKHAGKVYEIKKNTKEIIVGSSKAGEKFKMGKKVYMNIRGKTVTMIVVFPMVSIARCKLIGKHRKYLKIIKKGTKVYLTKKKASLAEIKGAFSRVDVITLHSGKKIKGAIVDRKSQYTILTGQGEVKVDAADIQNVEVIK